MRIWQLLGIETKTPGTWSSQLSILLAMHGYRKEVVKHQLQIKSIGHSL